MPLPYVPPALDTHDDFLSKLAGYRDMVMPVLLGAVPQREPRRNLYDLIYAHLSRPGKGLRPALCIATCSALGGDAQQALPSAAALELVHNAFLVHDDIEDGSEYRRDQPTMQLKYGVPLAVNTGDAMTALSMGLLKQNLPMLGPETTWRIFEEFDHMMIETIEGQAMELGWIRENNCEVTEDDYLLMSLKKTCWYSFIHPCRIGALIAERDPSSLDRFNRFGYYVGTAFQIQDDVLNLVGDPRKYGKEIGGDLLEGKRTLILAHLFKNCSGQEKDRLRTFLSKPRPKRLASEVAWVQQLFDRYGSIEHARHVAHELLTGAQRELEISYGGASGNSDRLFLDRLVQYVVDREL